MDSPEGWWTAIRSVPHELPTTDISNQWDLCIVTQCEACCLGHSPSEKSVLGRTTTGRPMNMIHWYCVINSFMKFLVNLWITDIYWHLIYYWHLLAASSSHSPTGPPLATEPFLLLVPRSGTVCHRRSHQRHHWTPFAGVCRLICSPCHIRTYNYRNWLTSVRGRPHII